jgi:hypothetical protein
MLRTVTAWRRELEVICICRFDWRFGLSLEIFYLMFSIITCLFGMVQEWFDDKIHIHSSLNIAIPRLEYTAKAYV